MQRDIFQAIADPTRRAILSLIAADAMTPGSIAVHFSSSRQAISKHIRILYECQLLDQRSEGRKIYYSLDAQRMKEVDDWLLPFRKI